MTKTSQEVKEGVVGELWLGFMCRLRREHFRPELEGEMVCVVQE